MLMNYIGYSLMGHRLVLILVKHDMFFIPCSPAAEIVVEHKTTINVCVHIRFTFDIKFLLQH